MAKIDIVKAEKEEIKQLSILATSILRELYDPMLGKEQNDYILNKYQTEKAFAEQFDRGYNYYWAKYEGKNVGMLGFYPIENKMYLSKLYLDKQYRGKKIGRKMFDFLVNFTRDKGLKSIFLKVIKKNENTIKIYEHLGFVKIREERSNIGQGYFLDEFVYEYYLK